MKRCPTCGSSKPLSDFYRDKRTKDGLKSQCKTCHTAGSVRTRDVDRKRASNAEHMARARAQDPRKFQERERSRVRHVDDRALARKALNAAVRSGKIAKPDACTSCGRVGRLNAHHDNYLRPLQVRWLCTSCHGREHRHA